MLWPPKKCISIGRTAYRREKRWCGWEEKNKIYLLFVFFLVHILFVYLFMAQNKYWHRKPVNETNCLSNGERILTPIWLCMIGQQTVDIMIGIEWSTIAWNESVKKCVRAFVSFSLFWFSRDINLNLIYI